MLLSRLPRRDPPPLPALDLSGMSAADREAVCDVAAELEHPWRGYAASPVGLAFHQSEAPNRYIIAASQSGKTMTGAREAWMYAGDCHPFRVTPKVSGMGLIAAGSLEGTASIGVPTALWKTRPDHLIDWNKTKWEGPTHWPTGGLIYMKNGQYIKIITSRGGSTGAASVQADWVWIDEPPKKDKFSELVARVTQTNGHIWLTFTPLDSEQDLTWLRLYLEGDAEKGIPPESPGWNRFNMELNVTNCPWMDQKQVDRIWAQTPKWIADQRLKGSWDTPPVNAYFQLDMRVHDIDIPFPDDLRCGPWVNWSTGDHGELAGHEHFVFFQVRKVVPASGPVFAQVRVLGEYVSSARTSIEEDAVGIKRALAAIADTYRQASLTMPTSWRWTADINTAGKGLAGVTVNEALAVALGMRKDTFELPDKGAGSVETGAILIRAALDTRPCPIRIATGARGTGAPQLWRSVSHYRGKNDASKHAVDALRYGVTPFLEPGSLAVRQLPDPERARAFAAIPQFSPGVSS